MRTTKVGSTILIGIGSLFAAGTLASETVTYTYDARGRLIKVEHNGGVNNGMVANYTLDEAGNREKVKVTGAP